MTSKPFPFKSIKDIFYQTRVLMGREYTLKRFASEILQGAVEPVMLSYIEKGKRFPTEEQVKCLAKVRGEDPQTLLVLLWQDRILYAFSREIQKTIQKKETPESVAGIEEGMLSELISRAIAALPDDGSQILLQKWRAELNRAILSLGVHLPADLLESVEKIVLAQGLIKIQGSQVCRLENHYVAKSPEEKQALAMAYCGIFTKSLLDKIVLKEKKTYLRNHYLQIPEDQVESFHQALDDAIRNLTKEFADKEGDARTFLNVLISSTK